jgi:hypothetical protein
MSKRTNKRDRANLAAVRRMMAEAQPCPPWCAGTGCQSDDRGRRVHAIATGNVTVPWQRGGQPRNSGLREVDVYVQQWTFHDPIKNVALSGTRVMLCVNDRGDAYVLGPKDARALAEALTTGADLVDASMDYPEVVADLLAVNRMLADPQARERVKPLIRWGTRMLAA